MPLMLLCSSLLPLCHLSASLINFGLSWFNFFFRIAIGVITAIILDERANRWNWKTFFFNFPPNAIIFNLYRCTCTWIWHTVRGKATSWVAHSFVRRIFFHRLNWGIFFHGFCIFHDNVIVCKWRGRVNNLAFRIVHFPTLRDAAGHQLASCVGITV